MEKKYSFTILAAIFISAFVTPFDIVAQDCANELSSGCMEYLDQASCGPVGTGCIVHPIPLGGEYNSCAQGADFNKNGCVAKSADYCGLKTEKTATSCTDYRHFDDHPVTRTITTTTYNYPVFAVAVVCTSWPSTTTYSLSSITTPRLVCCDTGDIWE